MPRPSWTIRILSLVVVVAAAGGCADDDEASPEGDGPAAETAEPAENDDAAPTPSTPITGGTGEDGEPLPPPVHATFSVVVDHETSWFPYGGPELTGLDTDAAAAIAGRVRRIDAVLTAAGIPASIELAYGPAAALCATDPGLLDELEDHGHELSLRARTNGESFRAAGALEDCGRRPRTASGLAAMADPVGPGEPTAESLADAMAVLAVQDVGQVTGAVSPLCEALGLAGATNNYGTGAFTAPWRSAWTEGNACTDVADGRIVVIDQVPLDAGGEGPDARLGVDDLDSVDSRFTQTLGWAADQRYKAPEELPPPGMLTWGVSLHLADMRVPAPERPADAVDGAADDGPPDDGAPDDGEAAEAADESSESDGVAGPDGDDEDGAVEARVAPLDDALVEALVGLLEEWQPAVEDGRLRWLTPTEAAAILRPT